MRRPNHFNSNNVVLPSSFGANSGERTYSKYFNKKSAPLTAAKVACAILIGYQFVRMVHLSVTFDPQSTELKASIEGCFRTQQQGNSSFDPHSNSTVLKAPTEGTGDSLPKYPLRTHLSSFSTDRIGRKYLDEVPKTLKGSNCLLFDCNQNVTECDNGDETNYNGDKPPCYTHVLRDMNRIFDEEMSALGLDYHVAFGSLLGLRRADRFIPWSADGDIMLHSEEAMNALVMLWDSQKTGMSHHHSIINRMCINPEFANGGLKKWAYDEERYRQAIDGWDGEWNLGFPYMDLYLFQAIEDGSMLQWGRCRHYYKDLLPTERKLVYDGQFAMNFPPNPDQILRTNYGSNWRFPPTEEERRKHGGRPCPYGPDKE